MIGLITVLALFCLFFLTTLYWYLSIPRNLPPGPLGLPFLGSWLHYLDGNKQHVTLLEDIKKYGPLIKVYIANKLVIVLGDYSIVQEALVKQGDVFSGRPQWYALMPQICRHHGLALSEGDLWKEHRRFALATLRDLGLGRPIIEPLIKEELEHFCDRLGSYALKTMAFDPQPLLTCAVSNIISQLIFGRRFSYDDQEFVGHFQALSRRSSSSGVGFLSPFLLSETLSQMLGWMPWGRKIRKETEDFAQYTQREIEKTMSTFTQYSQPTNYIHAFAKVAKEGKDQTYTSEQLTASVIDLFIAGTESIASTIRWGILLLAHNPQVQDRLYKEIREETGTVSPPDYADRMKLPYVEAVIAEIQRYANLVRFGVPRRTLGDTKLMGYDIPGDAVVIPFLENVLHNPEYYPQPTMFIPERFLDSDGKMIRDPKLIPFQAGKRVCLGESLGRMELFLLLTTLVIRFVFYFPDGQPKSTLDPIVGIGSMPTPYKVNARKRGDM